MPTPQPEDRVALGRARLAARARRVARIRRRVVAATLAAFALAWGVIVFDGSMGATTLASTTATTTTSTATATATATPTTSSSSNGSSGSTSSSPPAVTTSQS
jgi:hypothetical protein